MGKQTFGFRRYQQRSLTPEVIVQGPRTPKSARNYDAFQMTKTVHYPFEQGGREVEGDSLLWERIVMANGPGIPGE